MMGERPILFSGPMVRAILSGNKTQTRRAIKPQPPSDRKPCICGYSSTGWAMEYPDGGCECSNELRCPYGHRGDSLWVRETFCVESQVDGNVPPHSDGRPVRYDSSPDDCQWWEQPHYRATDPTPELAIKKDGEIVCGVKWRPSIFMPRWASRINLLITDIRAERVQDISDDDVRAEGVPAHEIDKLREYLHPGDVHGHAFGELWNSINERRGFGWATNPWVWVVEFENATDLVNDADAETPE